MAKQLNTVYLRGNLTKDGAVKEYGSFTKGELSIAVSESWKDQSGEWQERPSYFDVELTGRNASDATNFKKGTPVLVVGKLRQDRWEKDGKNYSKVVIRAASVEVVKVFSTNNERAAQPARQADSQPSGGDDLPF